MASCRAQFTPRLGWQYKLWNSSDVEALIRKHRPAYLKVSGTPEQSPCHAGLCCRQRDARPRAPALLQTFRGFPKPVQRIDAAKCVEGPGGADMMMARAAPQSGE